MVTIGIDLGTTNSLVSYWGSNGPELIPNALGQFLTPSVVSIDPNDQVCVGKIALEHQIAHPHRSVGLFKRAMGTKKKYTLGPHQFLPEELSALVIKSLKEDAEQYLNKPVEEAVISVPAYFSDSQKKATMRAGELAGLRVERLIMEPTAAAIAYGLHLKDAEAKFLVFDLGGGTFDVSILEFFDHIMEVRSVAGDNYLGGEDFTEVLVRLFLQHHGRSLQELDAKTIAMIRKQAENAKCAFSEKRIVTMTCPIQEEVLSLDISSETFENEIKPLFQRLRKPLERALQDACLKIHDIDAILLVGGATKLPMIRSFVSKLLGKLAFIHINPDEVVALGVAVQVALKNKNVALKEVVLTDVCPYTLGTCVSITRPDGSHEPGHFLPIIERNTTIPVSKTERVFTIYDRQKNMTITAYQGESRLAKNNIFLGDFEISIPSKPAGEEAVDIRFTYNTNGLLEVEATVLSTGAKKNIMIAKDPGHMTPEEIERSMNTIAHLKIHPRDQQENQLLLARGERLYEEHLGGIREKIREALLHFEHAIEQQDVQHIEQLRTKITLFFNTIEEQGEL